jgi:predicted cupin superfamily sugar epimerase
MWYFHKGVPLLIHVISTTGEYKTYELSDLLSGTLSVIIEAGWWFASEIPSGAGFALVSCAVAPGFEFSEFEMAILQELIGIYPQHRALLTRLCRA